MLEQRKRSILKAFTFRVLIIIIDGIAIYLITKRLDLTIGITALSNFYRTIIYYTHERLWNKIAWGKQSTIETKTPNQ